MVKSIRVAVAAAAVGVALTACSSPVEAGAAAIVGDERISASELSKNVREFEAALAKAKIPASQLQLPPTQYVLLQMVNVSQFQQVAAKAGAKITEGEVDGFVAAQGGDAQTSQKLLAQGVPPGYTREWLRTSIAISKLVQQYGGGTDEAAQQKGQQKLLAEAAAVKVTYSPRYGTFNPEKGFVDSARFGAPAVTPEAPAQQPQG